MGYQVARATRFCTVTPNIWKVLSVELASFHLSGAWNFEVTSRGVEALCNPKDREFSAKSCRANCVLSRVWCLRRLRNCAFGLRVM